MNLSAEAVEVKVADEVWIGAALLTQEHPDAPDFSIDEIVARVRSEGLHRSMRPGVYQHVVQHAVANRPPNPGRYRILVETTPGRRRLFRPGDPCDAGRERGKTTPKLEEIPEKYRELLDWYRRWSAGSAEERIKNDPLLALRGSGTDIWADEHADDYIRRMREGWE